MVDDISDIYVSSMLDFELDEGNDLRSTEYEDTPLQSVFIHVKNVIEPYIGRTVKREDLSAIGRDVAKVLSEEDPQVDSIINTEVDYSTDGEVTVEVILEFDGEFTTVEVSQHLDGGNT